MQTSIDCDYGIYQGKLVTFDINGNKIWEKPMVPYGPVNSIDPRKIKFNNDIVAMGIVDSTYFSKFKYLVLDSNGNVKSSSGYGRRQDVFNHDLGRGGSFTSDGGYITAMQLTGEPSPSPFYIIKLDSLGCDTTPEYCEWERTVSLKEQAQPFQPEVFPNPCNEVLNIGFNNLNLPAVVKVYDQSGRLLLNEEAFTQKHALNTTAIPQGLYLLEIGAGTGVFRRNFVVQR